MDQRLPFPLYIILLLFFTACATPTAPSLTATQVSTAATPTPTVTSTYTPSPSPTSTYTPSPTNTLVPTSTPAPTFTLTPQYISVINIEDVKNVKTFEHPSLASSIAFAADSNFIISGGKDGKARLWNIDSDDDKPQITIDVYPLKISFWVSFLHTGEVFVTSDQHGYIKFWSQSDGSLLRELKASSRPVGEAKLSLNDDFMIASSSKTQVTLWQLKDFSNLFTFTHYSYVLGKAFHPNGKYVVTGDANGYIWLWNVDDGSLIYSHQGHGKFVNSLVFSPDGKVIASGSGDGTIRLWNTKDGSEILEIQTSGPVWNLAFSRDGGMLASGGHGVKPVIYIWDISTGSLIKELHGHNTCLYTHICGIKDLEFSPNGKLLASAGTDNTIRLWSVIEP